jgi:hypothetical protein
MERAAGCAGWGEGEAVLLGDQRVGDPGAGLGACCHRSCDRRDGAGQVASCPDACLIGAAEFVDDDVAGRAERDSCASSEIRMLLVSGRDEQSTSFVRIPIASRTCSAERIVDPS